jgi:hypothetical protein
LTRKSNKSEKMDNPDPSQKRYLGAGQGAKAPESAVRKLLNDAGATPRPDKLHDNPNEPIPRSLVVNMTAI